MRRIVGDEAAAFENGEAMAALGLVHVMRGDEQGRAGVGQFEQAGPEIAARFRIDRAGRFVQQKQFRFVQHRTGQGEALLLAARHRAGQLLAAVAEMVTLDHLVHALHGELARQIVHGGEKLQVLLHRQVFVQRELLRHVADALLQRLGLFGNAQAQHFHFARARRQQAAEHAQRGGFARTIGAEEAIDLAARHHQVHVVHRDQRTEALGQSARADGDVGIARRVHRAGRACTGKPAGRACASLPSSTSSAR